MNMVMVVKGFVTTERSSSELDLCHHIIRAFWVYLLHLLRHWTRPDSSNLLLLVDCWW